MPRYLSSIWTSLLFLEHPGAPGHVIVASREQSSGPRTRASAMRQAAVVRPGPPVKMPCPVVYCPSDQLSSRDASKQKGLLRALGVRS